MKNVNGHRSTVNGTRLAAILFFLHCAMSSTPVAAQSSTGFPAAWKGVADFFHSGLRTEGVVGGSLWFLRGDSVLAREFHGAA
ncbi:MAG TPA: hypothetical protein VLB00_11765, partial [Gemmatimonadales bacterium]|nr:hypothetical protein [Gemmatimonadales bacterium]